MGGGPSKLGFGGFRSLSFVRREDDMVKKQKCLKGLNISFKKVVVYQKGGVGVNKGLKKKQMS